jgi:Ca2+-binding RTX toxin-like protein
MTTTFTGSFNTPGAPKVFASGDITLALNVDPAAGALAGYIWDRASGSGMISNYMLKVTGGVTHTGVVQFPIQDVGNFSPDINSGPLQIGPVGNQDSIRFDGNPVALTGTFDQASVLSNGFNLDGTAITGSVTIRVTGISDPVVVPLTTPLTGPAVPTLYNLAKLSQDVEAASPSVIKDDSGKTAWFPSINSDLEQTDPEGEFQAFTYANSDSSQVVIAFRGTVVDPNDLSTTFKTATTDFASFSLGIPTVGLLKGMQEAAALLAEVVQQYPNAKITLTGHSLGGAMAQMLGKASGYSTVAFDAPGASEIYNSASMQSALAATIKLGTQHPEPGSSVNIRTVGDWVSMQGVQFSTPVTIDAANPVYLDSPFFILQNHKMDTILKELKAPGTHIYQGILEDDAFILAGTQFIQQLPGVQEVVEKVALISYVANAFANLIDPSSGKQFIYVENANSPAMTAITFVDDPSIASFKVWSQVGDSWSASQTAKAGETITFAAGTHAIKFEGLSASGQVVALPDGYMFSPTLASTGQVTATLRSLNFDKLDGTNVQTPAPGQTSLTVSSSFNYTDAGNGNLTVNGTSSGNDTILLGSGIKTINLGSGNDFVMVKAGATGNVAVHGGAGDETILAGAANVTLLAGTGNILFIGGDDSNANAGFNTIDYSAFAGAVNVNLSTGIIQTGNGAIQTLVNVENVTGSPSGDTLAGDTRANTLLGGDGNDRLTGGGGNDRLDGGPGTDTAVYNAAAAAFALLSYNGTVAVLTHGADGDDRLQAVENIQFTDKTVAADTATAFDPWEYLASYPDLIGAFGANPQAGFDHYVDSGFSENRATNLFDPVEYLASNGDLIRAFGLNPLVAEQHYVTNGFNEHRATTSFDPVEYLASNGDLIRAFGFNPVAAEQHYVTNGFNEHRATTSFDPLEYLASNGDLIRAFGLNLAVAEQHYVQNGFNEHRATTSFDPLEYLASNGDLIHAFGLNLTVAEQHYVVNGFNEHRATASFDPLEYLASNGDLIRAFGLNLTVAEQHYVVNGFNEHRATTSFDAAQYLANYPDLTAAFGPNNLVAAEQHYVTNGFAEGRTDKAPVIAGNAGNNTLVAKNGAIMTGGAGADLFVFNFPLQKSAVITDFAAGADHVEISAAGFGHGLAAGGGATLVTAATAASASHAGTGGYFIFDNAGTVWWDQTGGSGADAIALAKLTGVASLHASDFLLV